MTAEEFYNAVAAIFGTEYDFIPPASGNTNKRWGPRTPGNGRFEGRGLVRFFSATDIHVALNNPPLTGKFSDPAKALEAIATALTR